jgi:hypothetical protein
MKLHRFLAVAAVVVVVVGGGIGIAIGTGVVDNETPITGDALERASAVALQHTGGGHVTDSELGDEEGYYEIEVTLADGTEVDVYLDQNFNVTGSDTDSDDAEDTED